MAEKIKSSVILFIVLIVLSLSLAGSAFYLLQKEKANSQALQVSLKDTEAKYNLAERELEKYKDSVTTLKAQLEESKSQIVQLTDELQQEKADREEAQTQIEVLRTDLEQQKSLRADLENKLTEAQSNLGRMQDQLKELQSKKEELEAKIKDLETQSQGVELGKIVVGPGTGQPERQPNISPPEGKVLLVNREYSFVVINLGSKDGVNIGDIFSLYHINKCIGDVKVEKVHDSMAAAGFLSDETKTKVTEGDRVLLKTQ